MRYIFIFSVLLSSFNVFSQSANDIGKIALHVVLPEEYSSNFENLGSRELKKIKSKIASIVSRNGVSGAGMGDFVIYPIFNIYEEDIDESGLEHLTIIRAEFTLLIQQTTNGQIYGEETIAIEGYGNSRSRALSKCIQNIDIRDKRWKTMINESKQKIIDYYTARCSDIQVEAEGHSKRRNYLNALAILMQVPVEVSNCYREITEKSVQYYDYYIELDCQEKISSAKVSKAQNDWDEAAGHLNGILPHYDCYKDAMSLLKDIEDHRCAVNLGKAKAAWARGEDGAKEAARYLALVPSDSKCGKEAKEVSKDIRDRLVYLDKRDWDLEYEKYNREIQLREDAQLHAQYMKEQKQQNENSIVSQGGAIIKDADGGTIMTTKINGIKDLVASFYKNKAEIAKSQSDQPVFNYNYYKNRHK